MNPLRPYPNADEFVSLNHVSFTHGQIKTVVDAFYTSVGSDEVLKVPFQSVHDWPQHIEHMTHFWWIRLGGARYLKDIYNPAEKHFFAGFNQTFLARWLGLFRQTLSLKLSLEQTELWALITQRIGTSLTLKNELYKKEYSERAGR